MNDSLLITDELLTKYRFKYFDEEVELFLTKDEYESISNFFELVNTTEKTWNEISEIICKLNPNVAYIIYTLDYNIVDKFKANRRNYKLENILNK